MIITLTGPSGSGKTTLARALLKDMPEARMLASTTILGGRSPRDSDLPKEYEYITKGAFNIIASEDEFAWQKRVHGNLFGTRKEYIQIGFEQETRIAILDISGLCKLHEYAREELEKEASVRSLYLDIRDHDEIRRRLRRRGTETEGEIEQRVKDCAGWHKQMLTLDIPFIKIDASFPKKEVLEAARVALTH